MSTRTSALPSEVASSATSPMSRTATAARGFTVEVHVAGVRRSRTDHLANGVEVHRHREIARLLSSPITGGLALAASRLDADIVHLHMPNPIGEIGALRNRRAGALLASFHAPVVRQRFLEPAYGPVRERVLGRCRTILVSSAHMASAPELAASNGAVRVLPYGVSPSLTSSNEPPRTVGPGGDAPPSASCSSVASSTTRASTCFCTRSSACTDRSAPAHDRRERARCGPSSTVWWPASACRTASRWLGAVDDSSLLELYRSHDVFVMPSGSRAETFGMAMCEAMAAGLPAVSTSVGTGTDWVNLDGVTGLVVPPGDPVALADALRTLAADADLRARLGRGARARARREFSFERHVDGLVETL